MGSDVYKRQLYGAHLPRLKSWSQECLSITGLTMIAAPAFIYSSEVLFPSWRALIPCLGTALLIYAGQHAPVTGRLLTLKPMVGMGLISYSLYLWHWPIFAFLHYATGHLDPTKAISGIALAILLSWLTWKYIEQPFRFKWRFNRKQSLYFLYLTPATALLLTLAVLRVGDGFIGRFGDDAVRAVQAMDSTPGRYRIQCPEDQNLPCADILLAGDSHAEHFGDFINVLSTDAGLTLNVDMRAGCPALWEIIPTYIRKEKPDTDHECINRSKSLYKQLHRYKYVALAGYWSIPDLKPDRYFFSDLSNPELSNQTTRKVLERAFSDSIRQIILAGSIPVIIKDNPTVPDQLFNCSRRKLLPFYNEPCEFSRAIVDSQQSFINTLIDRFAETHPSLLVIDPNKIICASGTCSTELEGMPIYRDDDHLNQMGSQILGALYIAKVGNPFKVVTNKLAKLEHQQ